MNAEEQYNYAMLLFEKQKANKGLRAFEKSAEAGHAEAQFQLASLIRDKRISRSDHEMIKFLEIGIDEYLDLYFPYQERLMVTA